MAAPPLPEPLPDNPLPLVKSWIDEATPRVRNATAMAFATVEPDGRPSARMVLCRGFDVDAGWFVFYTDRTSFKGRDLELVPRGAGVFYWEPFDRQVRIEGPVTFARDGDVEAYWKSRPRDARIAAVISDQSQPIPSRAALVARFEDAMKRYGEDVPRPARWIGYRLWAERVELWVSQPARLHDRAEWRRPLDRSGDEWKGGPWRATRLQP